MIISVVSRNVKSNFPDDSIDDHNKIFIYFIASTITLASKIICDKKFLASNRLLIKSSGREKVQSIAESFGVIETLNLLSIHIEILALRNIISPD
jgi:hypothetical protein